MKKIPFFNLRLRLLFILLIVVIPGLILAVYTLMEDRHKEETDVKNSSIRLAEIISIQEQDMIEGGRNLLISASMAAQIRGSSQERNKYLSQLLVNFPLFSNFGISDSMGNVIASAVTTNQKVNIEDHRYFHTAMETGNFAIGGYRIGKSPFKPSFNLAYPIYKDGKKIGVIFSVLSIEKLSSLESRIGEQLLKDWTLRKIDKEGILLAQYPNSNEIVGRKVPELSNILATITQGQGIIIVADSAGENQMFAYSQIKSQLFSTNVSLVLSVPEEYAFLEINHHFYRNLIFLFISGFLILFVGAFVNEIHLVRGLNLIQNAAVQLSLGNLKIRVKRFRGLIEVRKLGETFNEMISIMERRESERQQSEIELKRLQHTVEQSPVSVIITNTSGDIEYVNSKFLELTGYSKDDVLAKNVSLNSNVTTPGVYLDILETITGGAEWRGEFQDRKKDGSLFWLSASISAVRSSNGNITHFVAFVEDITEKKRVEKALSESEEQYRILIATVPDMIIKTDLDGVINFINEPLTKFSSGIAKENILGKNTISFVAPEDRDRAIEALNMRLEKQVGLREYKMKFDGENVIDCEVNGGVLRDIGGNPYGFVFVVRDISVRKQAEEEFRQKEKFLSKAEEVAGIGNWVFLLKENIARGSDGANKIYGLEGLEGNELSIPEVEQFPLPEYRALLEKSLKDLIDNNIPFDKEFKIIRNSDGKIVDIHSLAEYDPINNIVFGVIQDITEQKLAEKKLRETETRFRALFELSPDGIVILDPETARPVEFNETAHKQLDYSREEFSQLSIFDIDINETPEQTISRVSKVMRDKYDDFETRHRTKLGEIRNINVKAKIIDISGHSIYYCIWRDITEGKRAEEELKNYKDRLIEMVDERTRELEQSRETFRAIAENTKDIILRVNEKYQFLYMNPEMINDYGIVKEEYAGKTISELSFPQVIVEKFEVMLKNVFETKQNQHVELQMQNGEWGDLIAVPEYDIDGNVCSAIISARDITELKMLQLEIQNALEKEQELNKLKNNFISMISHEFRTPLTTVLSSSDFLESAVDKMDVEKKSKYFNRIRKNVEHMTYMLEEVLFINKMESEKIKVSNEEINLRRFCTEIFEEISESFPQIKPTLQINLESDYCKIDHELIRKILENIITNAFKYNTENGEVTFKVNSAKDRLIFNIIDTGIGIPEDEQAYVFQSFTRMSNSLKIKGTGLGLNIAKRAVEKLGGEILFVSNENKGTTFTVEIPVN